MKTTCAERARNLKEEKQTSMGHKKFKADSGLPVLRMNRQDFSVLTNEIPDWTDQSDQPRLCTIMVEHSPYFYLVKRALGKINS